MARQGKSRREYPLVFSRDFPKHWRKAARENLSGFDSPRLRNPRPSPNAKRDPIKQLLYTLDPETKLLTYQITDWVMEYTGEECMDGAVYATPGYGFVCMPRDITEHLAAIRSKCRRKNPLCVFSAKVLPSTNTYQKTIWLRQFNLKRKEEIFMRKLMSLVWFE